MDVIISNSGETPIYEQICRQIKAAVAAGKLSPGEALPSVRALARDTRISVITTRRAYEELEREGYIVTVPGKGSFVAAQNADLARESALREIEERLQSALELGRPLGLGAEELADILRCLSEEG